MQSSSELRTQAAKLRRIADAFEAAARGMDELNSPLPTIGFTLDVNASSENGRDLTNASGVEAIRRVLQDANRILNKEEISDELKRRGKALGDSTVMSYLSRYPDFVSAGNGRWDLRSRADLL